jgi:hypothetical protein
VTASSSFAVAKRNPALDDVPTFAEQGYPMIDDVAMMFLWVRPGVPAHVQAKVRSGHASAHRVGCSTLSGRSIRRSDPCVAAELLRLRPCNFGLGTPAGDVLGVRRLTLQVSFQTIALQCSGDCTVVRGAAAVSRTPAQFERNTCSAGCRRG